MHALIEEAIHRHQPFDKFLSNRLRSQLMHNLSYLSAVKINTLYLERGCNYGG